LTGERQELVVLSRRRVVSAIGQSIVSSSAKMTNGDPALAQASAQSELIGLFTPFVKAQAEFKT